MLTCVEREGGKKSQRDESGTCTEKSGIISTASWADADTSNGGTAHGGPGGFPRKASKFESVLYRSQFFHE